MSNADERQAAKKRLDEVERALGAEDVGTLVGFVQTSPHELKPEQVAPALGLVWAIARLSDVQRDALMLGLKLTQPQQELIRETVEIAEREAGSST